MIRLINARRALYHARRARGLGRKARRLLDRADWHGEIASALIRRDAEEVVTLQRSDRDRREQALRRFLARAALIFGWGLLVATLARGLAGGAP